MDSLSLFKFNVDPFLLCVGRESGRGGGDGSLWSYTNTPCELVNISE